MTTILIKKRDTTGAPGTANLTNQAGGAEIAVNTYDKRIYTMNSSSAVVELGTNPSSLSVANNASINILNVASLTLSSPIGISSGGTGQSTQQAALNAIAGSTTSGQYLRGNGTNVSMSSLSASDLTGTVAVANGGTGLSSTPVNGALDIGNGATFTRTTLTAGSGITVTNGTGSITIAASGSTGDITFSSNTISTANSNQNMILDPNGTGVVLVNCTTSDFGAGSTAMEVKSDASGKLYPIILESVSSGRAALMWNQATTGDNAFWNFLTESVSTLRGSITYNRAGGAVAYNTTSDYRSKDVYGPIENSGAQLDALKVYRGKMHGATLERPVMIAHELAEVAPYAVNGEKDALNEDGSPKFQQVDFTMLVPLLIAEIQSLRARVAALEAK